MTQSADSMIMDTSSSPNESSSTHASSNNNINYPIALNDYLNIFYNERVGRHVRAAKRTPALTVLFTEEPLVSSPFSVQNVANPIAPHLAIAELTKKILQDNRTAYKSLCHHVDVTNTSNSNRNTDTRTQKSKDNFLESKSPYKEFSEEEWRKVWSQVSSNAFTTILSETEFREWREAAKQEQSNQTINRDNKFEILLHNSQQVLLSDSFNVKDQHVGILHLYLKQSLLNHSCAPNAVMYWPNPTEDEGKNSDSSNPKLYALREIDKDEEVCISYRNDLLHFPTALRRQLIEQQWHFLCTCDRCEHPEKFPQDENMLKLTAGMNAPAQEHLTQQYTILSQYAQQRPHEALHPRMRTMLNEFFSYPLHFAHWRRHRIRSQFIPILAQDETCQTDSVLDDYPKIRFEALLREHIRSNALILPRFHPHKLLYITTYKRIYQSLYADKDADAVQEIWKHDIITLDPDATVVLNVFGQ
jgi:hypothetical protein